MLDSLSRPLSRTIVAKGDVILTILVIAAVYTALEVLNFFAERLDRYIDGLTENPGRLRANRGYLESRLLRAG